MKIFRLHKMIPALVVLLCFISCSKKKDVIAPPSLSVSSAEELFAAEGGSSVVNVTSNTNWSISNTSAWCTTTTSTTNGDGTITLQVQPNSSVAERSATLSVTAGNLVKQIKVKQSGKAISDIPPDQTGMSSNAVQLAAKIKLGWNIGNTLEATGGETAWGNPKATRTLIDFVKQTGFNAVRIPCSWNQYANASAEIQIEWLNRVKEVVQYCTDNDMYAMINIHWDGGWLENNCTPDKQVEVNLKQKAFWKQIATHFRDFDEHLLFASANEPNVENATQMNVLLSYHQTFIDAVRATGGRNSYRVLIVQGPSTDIEKTNNLMTALPVDPTPNRMMAEVHYYTPWQFAGLTKDESWGNMFYYWGQGYHSTADPTRNATWGEETDVDKFFGMMKTKFVDKGIPVVLGEYGAIRRTSLTGDALTLHLASRAYYLKYVTKQAKANGLLPFYWDEGARGDKSFGIINRQNNTVFDQQALDALIEGAK